MIDAYASIARDDHVISTPRFMALLQVTADRRLLELLAEPAGWAVIERRYLPLIELAAVREREDEPAPAGRCLAPAGQEPGCAVMPGYWMHETSGVLRPVIERFLSGAELSDAQVATMRAYLRQWMDSPWAPEEAVQALRDRIPNLADTDGIRVWLFDALEIGIDPL